LKVLAVTDGELETQSLRQALTSHGHHVNFTDRSHLLERIQAMQPDALVIDALLFPDSPLSVIREAKEHSPGLRIVAVDTSKVYQFEFYVPMALAMGADVALPAPVDYELILEALKEAGPRGPSA
jgi:ActR/RegA family two-component response regulator